MGDDLDLETTISDSVYEYALTHMGMRVTRGECWDLPYQALLTAHARTPRDLGRGLYVWGDPVSSLNDAQPGDIIQFTNVRIRTSWVTGDEEGWEEVAFGPRHSAVIESVDGDGFVTILHQNYNRVRRVQRLRLNISGPNVEVHGQIQVYRGIPRSQ